MNRSNSIL